MNPEHITAQLMIKAWPFPYGSGRIIDKLFSGLVFKQPIGKVKTSDGFFLTVKPNEHIGRHIYLSGAFDRVIVELLLRFAHPGDVMLDIGANIGYVSACFLHRVPRSSVVAVEPQPQVLDLLRSNLAQFNDRQKIYPYALGSEDRSVWFEIDHKNNGASKVIKSKAPSAVTVEMRAASCLFTELKQLDLVKIDAEGCEEEIVSASIDDLKRLKPRAIIFEGNSAEAKKLLRQIGYRLYGVTKKLHRLDLREGLTEAHDWLALS
jgi:FkbM family methyltransferase